MSRRILVTTDFSDFSRLALERAAALAQRFGTELAVLHVDPPADLAFAAPEPLYVPAEALGRWQSDHRARLDEELEAEIAALGTALPTRPLLRSGPIVDVIHETCRELDINLLVMSSHGGGATRFLLGSITEKVSRTAPCPVLIIPGDADPDAHQSYQRAVVGVDYSPASLHCAEIAAELVEEGGTLELVHAWDDPYLSALHRTLSAPPDLSSATESARSSEIDRIEAFRAQLGERPIAIESYLGSGSPADVIHERATEMGADLIVVGSHGRDNFAEKLLGTVADRVIRHAELPTLLVPRRD